MGKKEKDKENKGLPKDSSQTAGKPLIPAASLLTPEPPSPDPQTLITELEKKELYLRAEIENVRKRLQKDKMEHGKAIREMLLDDIFPIFLSLNRAIKHDDGSAEKARQVCEGIKMTLKTFEALFNKHGLEQITGTRCPFDPAKHEALDSEPRDDITEKIVLEEYEPGFLVQGQLVRPAKVKVGIPVSKSSVPEKSKEASGTGKTHETETKGESHVKSHWN